MKTFHYTLIQAFYCILSVLLSVLKQPNIIFLLVYVGILLCMGVLAPFISAMIFDFQNQGIQINFGFARGMGSASYAVASLILGSLTASYGVRWLPVLYIALGAIMCLLIYTFTLPKGVKKEVVVQKEKVDQPKQNFFKKYPLLTQTFIAVIFLFFGFNLMNGYLVQIVRNVGGDQSQLGIAMFLAAIVELPAMTLTGKLANKLGHYRIMMIAAIFFGVKHTMMWMANSLTMIYIAQLLQFCSYAFFIPSSVFLVSNYVENEDAMKGQALMTGATAVGGVGATYIGGLLLDSVGVSSTLLCATLVTWVGSILLIYTMKKMIKKGN